MTRWSAVGASAWQYRISFLADLPSTYRALQERVLAEQAFVWDYDKGDEDFPDDELIPRPASLDELVEAKAALGDEFWEAGTHSILDTDRVVTVVDPERDLGTIRVLSASELQAHFGTDRPSLDHFQRRFGPGGPAPDDLGAPGKWNGVCAVLYDNGRPAEVAFWGWSGD
jgi:hypothetical protein